MGRSAIAAFSQHGFEGVEDREIALSGIRVRLDRQTALARVLNAQTQIADREFPSAGKAIGPCEFREGLAVVVPDIHPEPFGLDLPTRLRLERSDGRQIEERYRRPIFARIGIDDVEGALRVKG